MVKMFGQLETDKGSSVTRTGREWLRTWLETPTHRLSVALNSKGDFEVNARKLEGDGSSLPGYLVCQGNVAQEWPIRRRWVASHRYDYYAVDEFRWDGEGEPAENIHDAGWSCLNVVHGSQGTRKSAEGLADACNAAYDRAIRDIQGRDR